MTPEFAALLRQDPTKAIAQLRDDPTISFWLKDMLLHLHRRDLLDVLYDLDLLVNVVEALSDHRAGRIPRPGSRLHPLSPESEEEEPQPGPFEAPLDQCPAEICIGGTLDRLLIPDLLTTVGSSGVCLGWETPPFTPTTEPELCQALDLHHHLHFYNSFAPEGEFPLLEAWLIQHQLGFTRTSMGNGSYQAQRAQFRRGLRTPIEHAVDQAGHELIARPALCIALQYLKEGAIEHAETLLERTIGPSLAPLPPFRIEATLRHPILSDHPA